MLSGAKHLSNWRHKTRRLDGTYTLKLTQTLCAFYGFLFSDGAPYE